MPRIKIVCKNCGKFYGYTLVRAKEQQQVLAWETGVSPSRPAKADGDPASKEQGTLEHRSVGSIDYQAVRRAISMNDVLALLNFVEVSRNGTVLRGPCPIHGESGSRSRSFSVDLSKHAFRCFKAGCAGERGGNQLDLWSLVTKSNLYDAARDLCERFGITVPVLHNKRQSRADK